MPKNRQPFRENGFRIITSLIGVVIGVVVVFVLRGSEGAQRAPVWAYVVGVLVAVVVAGVGLLIGLLIGKRIVGDRIEAAVREPGGKWRHGRFVVARSGATFERYRWQIRIPSGKKTDFTGVELGDDTGKRPPLRQLWSINPQLHIVTLDSDQGHYEVAAMPSLQQFRERLGEPQLDPR